MHNFPLSRWEMGHKLPPYEKGLPLATIPEMESVTTYVVLGINQNTGAGLIDTGPGDDRFVLATDASDDKEKQTMTSTRSTIHTAVKHSRNFQRKRFPRRWRWMK